MHKRKIKHSANFYAKILFVISIAFFIYGFVLDYVSTHKLIDPIKNAHLIHRDSTISITTQDGSEIVPGNTIENSDDNDSNHTSNRREEVISNPIDSLNLTLRDEIEKKYGLTVEYGKETDGYSIHTSSGNISTISISDSETIYKQLDLLKKVLSLYPDGLFQEIKKGGIPLTVMLIQEFSEKNITGITDSSYSYANISIAATHGFEESFFHESYHYIERYLFKKGASFNSWNSLNPSDFEYGTIYSGYSYSNTFSQDSFFVNNYAQTAATEDRASTFEFMMASNKATCLNQNMPVWRKARYMATTMDYVLKSATPSTVEYWERFL